MSRLVVYLNDFRVGVLRDEESPVFAYDQAWLDAPEAYPLSRQLPLQPEPFAGLGWPMVRERLAGLTAGLEKTLDRDALDLVPDAARLSEPARQVVSARTARMQRLIKSFGSLSSLRFRWLTPERGGRQRSETFRYA